MISIYDEIVTPYPTAWGYAKVFCGHCNEVTMCGFWEKWQNITDSKAERHGCCDKCGNNITVSVVSTGVVGGNKVTVSSE